jgi:GNAT superfamily N-acetyltransferase
MLSNPFWFALRTEHAHFALGQGPVLRYPADVIPFAGLRDNRAEDLMALRDLLGPEEKVFVVADDLPGIEGLNEVGELPGLQLHFNKDVRSLKAREDRGVEVRRLGPADASAMISLTDVAFPGFFRERTYQLGSYFGVFCEGELVAMAGERIALPGMREISAVCTHPQHSGNGYATVLIQHLLRFHAERGLHSFLHVAAENQRAVGLYVHLGFVTTASLHFRQIQRLSR